MQTGYTTHENDKKDDGPRGRKNRRLLLY